MADEQKQVKDNNKQKPLDSEVTELDDQSLEKASGGVDANDGDIVINNCNC